MIIVNLNIDPKKLTREQEDALRHHMSHSALQWVFAMCDTFARQTGLDFNHKDVGVTGEVLLSDPPAEQPAQG